MSQNSVNAWCFTFWNSNDIWPSPRAGSWVKIIFHHEQPFRIEKTTFQLRCFTFSRIFEIDNTRIMITKLTLTLDDSVIAIAKQYAKKSGKSLSDIVENYLKTLTSKEPAEEAISPRILNLMGVIELPENFDYKSELSRSLSKKYKPWNTFFLTPMYWSIIWRTDNHLLLKPQKFSIIL